MFVIIILLSQKIEKYALFLYIVSFLILDERKKMSKTLTASEMCPMDLGINILSGKWKLKILWNIQRKNIIRFNELQKLLGSITTKTLTNQLRELEEQKIIRRNVYPEVPPKVEYSLTELGESIIPVLKMLCEWGKEYQKAIKN